MYNETEGLVNIAVRTTERRSTVRILIVIVTLLLSGCATTQNSYVPPGKENTETATIISSWTRNGLTDWEGYSIETIDGKYVSYGLTDKDWVTFNIYSGKKDLVVHCEYNRTFGGSCPCEAYSELSFIAEPGKNYMVTGEVNGLSVDFWVIDKDTKEIVSEKSSGDKRRQPQDVYMPLYIPM